MPRRSPLAFTLPTTPAAVLRQSAAQAELRAENAALHARRYPLSPTCDVTLRLPF